MFVVVSNSCCRDEIYIAPSGVQKERMKPEDIFVQDIDGNDLELPPPSKKLKKSQCTPLFMCAYTGKFSDYYSDRPTRTLSEIFTFIVIITS